MLEQGLTRPMVRQRLQRERVAAPAPTFAVQLHISGHALYIVSLLAQSSLHLEVLRYAVYASMLLLAISGAMLIRPQEPGLAWGWVLLIYLLLMLGYGLVRGNWSSYWAADICNFGTALGLWAGTRPDLVRRIIRVYGKALILCVCISGPLLFLRLEPGNINQRIVGEGFLFDNFGTLVPSLFLVFFMKGQDRWFRGAVYLGLTLQILFGLMTASRGAVFMPFIAMALTSLTFRKKSLSRLAKSSAAVLVVALAAFSVWTPAALEGSVRNLEHRLSQEDQTEGRRDEAEFFVENELAPAEFIIGRGMGGAHLFIFDPVETKDYNMVHYGYLHLVLKGGGVLLCLVGLMVFLGIARARRSGDPLRLGAMLTLMIFIVSNIGHTQFLGSALLPFFWVAMGQTLSTAPRTVVAGAEGPM